MANLLKWLGNAIGSAADAIIPGDQSSWHAAPTPPQPVDVRPAMPSLAPGNRATAAQLPNLLTGLTPPAPPTAAKTPSTPADLIDYINNAAKIGPKAVNTPVTRPDFAQGGSEQGPSNNPFMRVAEPTLQALGQIPLLGWPVQLANEANSVADRTAAGEKVNPLVDAAKTGVANSPLGAAGQLFGGIANSATQALGINNGTTAAESNPLFGETNSFSNQVRDQGLGTTILNNAMNVAGSVLPGEKPGGPTVGEAAGAAKAANARLGEGGFIDPNAQLGPRGLPETPKVNDVPAPPIPLPKDKVTRYASKTVPESNLISEPIRTTVKAEAPTYKAETEAGRMNESAQKVNASGPDAFIADVQKRLDKKTGTISSQDVTDAHTAAAGLDARGDELSLRQASDIYKRLSEHLTASGQTVQAAALIARRSPQGLKYQAIHDLTKAGVDITPELSAKIDAHIKDIASAPDKATRNKGVAGLSKTVLKEVPQSTAKNLISVWKAGLLSGVKTQGGNFVSNATFGLMHDVSNPLATLIDKGISTVTGERTKTTSFKGGLAGAKEGIGKGIDTLKTGIDERNIGADGKYEQHAEINFKNPIVQKFVGAPSNFVFRGMSAADQPFYYKQLRNSLADLGKADGVSQGLKGDALKAHIDEFSKNPSEKGMQTAVDEANKAVLGNDTFASKIISGAKQAIDRTPFSDAGKTAAHAVIDILAPFTKVPSAFITRVVDFTPIGPMKEVFSQIANKKFDQRALSTALSEATTGTAVLAVGYKLATAGNLSGDYPKNDPKEAARWKAEHITPNSVKVGDKWYSLNYLGPVGLLFNAANTMKTANDGGASGTGSASAAIAGLGQGLLGQSFLQGFSGFSDAIKDPERSAKTYVNSQASSIVPAWSNDLGNLTDNMQRQANTVWEAIKSRIPGARNDLAPKHDTFGNDLEQPSGGANAALNPLKPSTDEHNPMLDELDRLSAAKQAVFPVESKTIGSGDNTIKLTPEQTTDRTKRVGEKIQPLWSEIMNTPGYAALDDAHKKDALQRALSDIGSSVDRQMTTEIDSSKLGKPASGNVAQILMGHPPTPTDYVNAAKRAEAGAGTTTGATSSNGSSVSASASGLTPAERYQAARDKYEADKAAGRLSPTQDFVTQQSLGKQSITSKYDQTVLDLYGMSTNQRNAFLASHPDQQGNMSKVAQLSSELKSRNFTSTDKIAKASGGKKGKKPAMPKVSSLTANSASRKLLGGTSKGFKVPKVKVAKAKTGRHVA